MKIRVGVDTGGTFTDLVLFAGGEMRVHKVRSTPEDPSRAILRGVGELLQGRADEVIHGSTVATNALLERKGARIAFLVTAGFEHILHIGRQTRRELYRLNAAIERPLVEDGLIFGVRERMGAFGELVQELEDEEISRLATAVRAAKPEAVAICLLHAYAFPEHERRLADELRRAGFAVSASHEILPEYREYERASTTAVNAYVSPVMSRYLAELAANLPSDVLRVTQSSGGFVSAEEACSTAAVTVLSGPAGGAAGALALAQASEYSRVIAFDMGGTSTDVSLLDGALPVTSESVVGSFPVRLPSIDIHSVGAGGGSIAFIDAGGSLRVGPRSAGAVPGPACYGVGDELTVTDANLLLGRLDSECFLGGRMRLDVERARRLAGALAGTLQLRVEELAEGIVRIANSNMERALRVVSVQRGHDTRDFALLAFGGAGGMHACDLAAALDIQTVLVPQHAGILSALGMLLSDYTKQYLRSVLQPVEALSEEELRRLFDEMKRAAYGDLLVAGFEEGAVRVECALDVRYQGQSFELTVPFEREYRKAFDRMHERFYGYHDEQRACEVVNLRLKAIGETEKPQLPRYPDVKNDLRDPLRTSQAVFKGSVYETPLYVQESLLPGMSGTGPAIIAGGQATTVVPPEWQFRVDAVHTMVLTQRQA